MLVAVGPEQGLRLDDFAEGERVLAIRCDARGGAQNAALLTNRRVAVVALGADGAHGADARCFFPDGGDGVASGSVATDGCGRVACLRLFDDGGGEAAFFEASTGGGGLKRLASGRKTKGRTPRWVLGGPRYESVSVVTRCGALVELGWRGAYARESRVVPAAVGTDLEVYDGSCCLASGTVACVVKQRSEGHSNDDAFAALLEPGDGKRRRAVRDATLGFGSAVAVALEPDAGDRVVVAWVGGLTVHATTGGPPLFAYADGAIDRG